MSEEEKKAVEYYKNKEISFKCDFNTEELLKALGIEESEEDSFEKHQIRFKTLLNLIQKQEGKIKLLKDQLRYVIDEYGETIEKQEKIIDKMAEYFEGYEMNDVITFENKEQVKEYFEEEVEKE